MAEETVGNRDAAIAANRGAGYAQGAQQATAPPPPQPAPAPAADPIAQLKELAELKNQGILTEEEFAAQKAKILAQ